MLKARDISLSFAELKDPVKDKFNRFEIIGDLGGECFFPTIESAVASYRSEYPAG